MRGLKGKRTIVTGGGSGIGREVCKRFAEEGSEVAVFDINAAGATETVKIIGDAGGKATAHAVDITERAAVDAAVAEVEKGGPINVLVNNAGSIIKLAPIEDCTDDVWDSTMGVNLKGVFLCSQAVIPYLKEKRRGRIINVSSGAVEHGGMSLSLPYAAAKAAE